MTPVFLSPEPQNPSVLIRLAARRPAYAELNDKQFAALQKAFEATHCWVNGKYEPYDAVYLFHDNTVVPEPIEVKRMTSRTAQLVAIATNGMPIRIGRVSFARWGKNKLTQEEQAFKDYFGMKWWMHFDHTKKDYAKET